MVDRDTNSHEVAEIEKRYARRGKTDVYSILRPEVILATQEWQRRMLQLFGSVCRFNQADLRSIKLIDVGCGYGGHILDFLRFGFAAENLGGIELLRDRFEYARSQLPDAVTLHLGDAAAAPIAAASQDIVFQSVVFSSILDDAFQKFLADRMWAWLKPGGGILWYDFVVDNPSNRDVRGVPIGRVQELFPSGRITRRRVTLAPPISRRVCRLHPVAYHLFNVLPFLRTHVLCWISKHDVV